MADLRDIIIIGLWCGFAAVGFVSVIGLIIRSFMPFVCS